MNRIDDFLLKAGPEFLRTVVIDHRVAAFVTAFLEHALARDVARRVVRVGDDGEPRAIELALQPQRIIHDDLAGEEDERELIREAPRLNRVIDLCRQSFAAVELREIHTRMMADGISALRAFLPFGARARLRES